MRGSRGAVAAAAAVTAALLLVWGAAAGDPLLSAPDVSEPGSPLPDADPTEPSTPTELESAAPGPDQGAGLDWWLVVQLVLIAAVLWAAWRWFRSRQHDEVPHGDDASPRDELTCLLEATAPTSPSTGPAGRDPRNDVVACWAALEDGVARAGLTPEPSETSADLARRVLRRWHVDEDAVDRLATLYREARFSRHPITPAHGEDAHAALATIRRSLADSTPDPSTSVGGA